MRSNNFSGSSLTRQAAPNGNGSEHERTRALRKTNYNGDIYKTIPKNVVTIIRSFRCVSQMINSQGLLSSARSCVGRVMVER